VVAVTTYTYARDLPWDEFLKEARESEKKV
jgi:hypothetical protein